VPSWRAPADDQIASSPAGVPPADSAVDPATGATIVRRVPDDVTSPMSASGVLPYDVEVDSATGVPTARQGWVRDESIDDVRFTLVQLKR